MVMMIPVIKIYMVEERILFPKMDCSLSLKICPPLVQNVMMKPWNAVYVSLSFPPIFSTCYYGNQ